MSETFKPVNNAAESAPSNLQEIDLSEFFGEEQFTQTVEGHFGVLPAVKMLEIVNETSPELKKVNKFKLTLSKEPISINSIQKNIQVGYDEVGGVKTFSIGRIGNFASLEVLNENLLNINDFPTLTTDERKDCGNNPEALSYPERLELHKGEWSLSVNNSNFHMKEISGERNSNYGYFTVDLDNEKYSYLKNVNSTNMFMLIEIASQQIAATLIKQGNTPVFKSMEIVKFQENIGNLGGKIECEFRISYVGKRDVSLSLYFKNDDGYLFMSQLTATEIPVSVLKKSLGIR